MDTLNFIKIAVEQTPKKEPVVKSKEPIVNRDKEDLLGKSNEQDTFSKKLENEINSKNSQKNGATQKDCQDKDKLSGNKLPQNNATSTDKPQEKASIEEAPIVETPIVETPIVETPIVETPIVEAPIVEVGSVATPEAVIVDAPIAEAEIADPIQAIFQQISSSKNISQSISDKGEVVISTAEILKSIVDISNNKITPVNLASTIAKPVNVSTNNVNKTDSSSLSSLSSLFQGSLSQTDIFSNFSGNATSGFDSSSSQQQSPLMQQFSELQMKLLSQDKLVEENNFDISKLSQVLISSNQNSSVTETVILNQNRSISELMIKTPVMDKHWNSDFSNQIAFMAKSGGGNALIKLNPAHLGPVEASIKVSNEVATIHIVATNLTTREAMDNAIPRLKEMLQDQGFSQVNVDISEKGFSHDSLKDQGKTNKGTLSANDELAGEEQGDFFDNDVNLLSKQSVIDGVVNYYA